MCHEKASGSASWCRLGPTLFTTRGHHTSHRPRVSSRILFTQGFPGHILSVSTRWLCSQVFSVFLLFLLCKTTFTGGKWNEFTFPEVTIYVIHVFDFYRLFLYLSENLWSFVWGMMLTVSFYKESAKLFQQILIEYY